MWRSRLMIRAAPRSCPSTSPTTRATRCSLERDDVVPVATDLDADRRRPVARRDVPAADGRDGVGQQVALQLVRDPPLAVVRPGPDHHRADLLGQLLGQARGPARRSGGPTRPRRA